MLTPALRKLAFACVACMLVAATPAEAVLMSADDPVFGPGSITTDGATGLEWLDVDQSTNWSYNAISAEFGIGGVFEGWRHATQAETTTLLSSTSFPVGHGETPANAGIIPLIHLLGETFEIVDPPDIIHELYGINASAFPSIYLDITALSYAVEPDFSIDISQVFETAFGPGDFNPSLVGHWLVRSTTVPEPSTLAIFGLGLAGLGVMRRRRRVA